MSDRPRIRLRKIVIVKCPRCQNRHRVVASKGWRCLGYYLLPLDLI